MAIAPSDLLKLAGSLLAAGDEASLRSAISRAYYAAYHATLPIVNALPAVSASGGIHAEHVGRLRQCPPRERCAVKIKTLGRLLNQERLSRRLADYFLDRAVTSTTAGDSVKVSARAVELANWVHDQRNKVSTGK